MRRSKPLLILLPIIALLALAACSGDIVRTDARPAVIQGTAQNAPVYPAIALYIVYREYVNQKPGIRQLSLDDRDYQKYVEKRLRQLYPGRGYDPMMSTAVAEYRRRTDLAGVSGGPLQPFSFGGGCDPSALICDDGSPNQPVYQPDPSWDGQQEHAGLPEGFVPTLQEEIDSLQLTQPEIQELYYYESLASGSYRSQTSTLDGALSTDDLIRAAAERRSPAGTITPQVNPVYVGVLVGTGVWALYKIYRAQKAADRAFEKAAEYYPSLTGADDRRDAFRHIFWNVQLRRWLTAGDANYLATRHEDSGAYNQSGTKYADNPANSKVMDLHNNAIGHHYKYHHFRGHWFWDRWNTDAWSRRVRDYINDPANGVYIGEWVQAVPTLEAAWQREAAVPRASYIFFL